MEKRAIADKPEVRNDSESGKSYIEGYGIVFNKESRMLGDFVEVIERSAVDDADMTDIMGRYNHEVLIGRSTSGTLTYTVDDYGVKYRIELPKSATGEHIRELVERGDVDGSSFMFDIADGGQRWEEQEDKTYKRYISKFGGVYDMGPVDRPAYPDTTVAKRSLDEFKTKAEEEKREKNNTEEKGMSIYEAALILHRSK